MRGAGPIASLAGLLLAAAAPAPGTIIADLDLAPAFGPGWRLTATQGPPVDDIIGDDKAPGAIQLCVHRAPARACDPALGSELRAPAVPGDAFTQPHFLDRAAIVFPRGPAGKALLLVRASSLHSGDGDQVVVTQLFGLGADGRPVRVFRQETGHNNNQEVRFLDLGPLRGAIVVAEPTRDAPFGYWLGVYRLGIDSHYHQVARFRSATRYNDGNPLAVIDAEMPAIRHCFGLWRPGQPLPLPAGRCARPHLVLGALWC